MKRRSSLARRKQARGCCSWALWPSKVPSSNPTRLKTQSDELGPHAEDRSRHGCDRAGVAAEGGHPRSARGYKVGPRASRERIADVSRKQPCATGENSTGQGRTGSRNPCECGGQRNCTDPDRWIMKTLDGFVQGCRAGRRRCRQSRYRHPAGDQCAQRPATCPWPRRSRQTSAAGARGVGRCRLVLGGEPLGTEAAHVQGYIATGRHHHG